jgi:uncharacterized membrane protein
VLEHALCGWFSVVSQSTFQGETVASVITWVPAYPWLIYLNGFALLAAGLCLAGKVRPRLTATLLGILFLMFVLFLEAPRLIHFGVRITCFETLAICGAALMLAGTLPSESHLSHRWSGILDLVIKSGRFFFAISSIVFGIDHLLYISFVASLVPWWIPWHLFWAYFTGFAFIAVGVSIGTKWLARWSGALLGTMFLLWFVPYARIIRAVGRVRTGCSPQSQRMVQRIYRFSHVWRILDLRPRLV